MIPYEKKEHYTIDDLAEIVTLLRSKDGCPWDKVQTHESIRPDLIEETYEVIEAIDQNDPEMLREELGDLLLQVVFHSRIETEQGHFTLDDVCTDICNKLIIRHPHVFSTVQADTTEEVLKNWDTIKEETKHQTTRTQTLEAVAKTIGIPSWRLIKDVFIPQTRDTMLEMFSYFFVNSMITIFISTFTRLCTLHIWFRRF